MNDANRPLFYDLISHWMLRIFNLVPNQAKLMTANSLYEIENNIKDI